MTDQPGPEEFEGFNVPYEYYDDDDKTRRRDIINYVGEPLTKEIIERRMREREQEGNDD
jgi:hypothetical protein